jgi:2-C-methyl-D-erythritol 4-phosphate cytidylyltransferase
LEVIEDEGIVFIHDAVRPLVSMQTIRNCYQLAVEKGNALPVVPVTESLRYADENSTRAVPRSSFFIVQTPQTFHVKLIKEAYQQDFTEYFTDDASVLESAGGIIQLVDGNRENIKITYPDDFVYAQALIGLNKPVKQ